MSEEGRKKEGAEALAWAMAQAEKQRVHLHSMLWAQFATAGAAAGLANSIVYAADAAEFADELLEEWISRFEESEDGDE